MTTNYQSTKNDMNLFQKLNEKNLEIKHLQDLI